MSPRTLKIALAVSVALNLFAVAAAVTTVVTRAKVEERVAAQTRAPQPSALRQMLDRMDPEVRARARKSWRASLLAARPDFEAARAARREAIALAAQPTYDGARLAALLDQSRDAELRGRKKLEVDAIQLLSTLEPKDRAVVAQVILAPRLGRSGRGSSSHTAATRAAPAQ